jgi:hypothetical protein
MPNSLGFQISTIWKRFGALGQVVSLPDFGEGVWWRYSGDTRAKAVSDRSELELHPTFGNF